jgi:hypothetical protein
MPKLIEYPSSSFSKAMELADAVDYLGGTCSIQSSADKLNKKVSGGFGMLISSALKHGLINRKREELSITELYREIKLSYTPEEKLSFLRQSFLAPVLYNKIYEKFKGKELPIPMLSKLLVREYSVDADAGSRIAGYFVEGLKYLDLLLDNNKLVDISSVDPVEIKGDDVIETSIEPVPQTNTYQLNNTSFVEVGNLSSYTIHIKGPGIDSRIVINENDDLLILDAMIKKIKNKLNEIGNA